MKQGNYIRLLLATVLYITASIIIFRVSPMMLLGLFLWTWANNITQKEDNLYE